MTVFSGFFNSNNTHDRMYNAEHFSRFFDGLICDGVYISYPYEEEDKTKKAFYVKPAVSGLAVTVATGRAWFDGIWLWNDSALNVTLDPTSNELMQRIDAIVLDIDKTDAGRQGQILVVKGTEDTKEHTVYRPTLIDQPTHKQYPIAFVNVLGGATSISAANITYTVGTNDPDAIPIVRALLELADEEIQAINARFDADENPSYTEAATLAEPISGEPVTTLYGKIKKLFTTLFAGRSSTTPKFLRHDLTYATPPVTDTTQPGYCPQRPVPAEQMEDDKYKYLRADGSWAVPPGSGEGGGDTVIQRSAANANNNFKVLLSATDQAVNDTDITKWDTDFRYNPSTDNLTVGSVNEVKLGKSNGKYGYYDGNTFKSFRQPTGDAETTQVLSGHTFSNAIGDGFQGAMPDRGEVDQTLYGSEGSNPNVYLFQRGYYEGLTFTVKNYHDENTYTYPTGSTGTPIVDLGTYHNIRYVNAANVYQTGKDAVRKALAGANSGGTDAAIGAYVPVSGAGAAYNYNFQCPWTGYYIFVLSACAKTNYGTAQSLSCGWIGGISGTVSLKSQCINGAGADIKVWEGMIYATAGSVWRLGNEGAAFAGLVTFLTPN